MKSPTYLTRRQVVAAALAGAVTLPFARVASASDLGDRSLELFNTHTGERITAAFRTVTGYVAASLSKLDHLLRDHRANEAHEIDPALYDQLADLALAAGREPRFEIISGYRSPRTNANLASASGGVATKSLHMQGRALDIRLKGVSCADLRDLALQSQRGGVGYYRRSDFVHVDTGRVRQWAG